MTYEAFLEDMRKRHAERAPFYAGWKLTGDRLSIERPGLVPLDVIRYTPASAGPWPVVINIHGGGFTDCDAVQTGSLCRLVADRCGALAININYRKAPEYPFPYALEEVCDLVGHLADNAGAWNIDADRIVLMGESAGANLAIGAALMLRDSDRPTPVGQILVYPGCDPYGDYTSAAVEFDEWLVYSMRCYLGDADRRDPRFCMLAATRAQLDGLPPTAILTCELDTLREQGELLAKRLAEAFVPVSLRRFRGAQHGFVEVNRPDWGLPDERITPEQDALARQAEAHILAQLSIMLAK